MALFIMKPFKLPLLTKLALWCAAVCFSTWSYGCGEPPRTESPSELEIDPAVIAALAEGQRSCESQVTGSPQLKALAGALERHYSSLVTLVEQTTEFPLSLTIPTNTETLRFYFYDSLNIKFQSPQTTAEVNIARMPNDEVSDDAIFQMVFDGDQPMRLSWAYSTKIVYFHPRGAPDDIRSGVYLPWYKYECTEPNSAFSYVESPGVYQKDGYSFTYRMETSDFTYSLEASGKNVTTVTVCTNENCETTQGTNWSYYSEQLGSQAVFVDGKFRVPFVPRPLPQVFELLESKQEVLYPN